MTKKKQTKQTSFDSNGSVYRPVRHGVGVWGNPRVPMTVRVDAKLKLKAKSYLIRKFGSTCRGMEAIFAALLKSDEVQQDLTVYRQPTTSINFEKVVIERNLRSRRKLVVEEEEVERRQITYSYAGENREFRMVADQWDLHPDPEWRSMWFNKALKLPDLEGSKRIQKLYRKVTGK